jgi:hypothetical protein
MGRLYLSPQEISLTPIGIALSSMITMVQNAGTGALDLALMRASVRCDAYCNKRLQAPQTTTLSGSGTVISPGGTSVPVVSTLGWDGRGDEAVIINVGGGTQEIIPLVPGGVQMNSPIASPYPGTLTLAYGTQYAHSADEPVAGCYQEVTMAGSSSSSDVWSESQLTQQSQIAQAHAPTIGQGSNLTRLVFVKHYPIMSILKCEHAYPFNTQYVALDVTSLIIEGMSGFYKFPLGSVVIPQGYVRTTYIAGFQYVPDPVKNATAYYLADDLHIFQNISGAMNQRTGNRSQTFVQGGANPKTLWMQKAEQELDDANLRRRT